MMLKSGAAILVAVLFLLLSGGCSRSEPEGAPKAGDVAGRPADVDAKLKTLPGGGAGPGVTPR
jgi:hypothetical protein